MAAAQPQSAAGAAATMYVSPKAITEMAKHKIHVGHGCVLHPYCKIAATNGPIILGEYCIFGEYSCIENVLPPDAKGKEQTLVIGNYNVFEPHSVFRGVKIGDGNRIDALASVGVMSTVGSGCVLQPRTRVTHDTLVPDCTVVYGENSVWATRERDEKEEQQQVLNVTRWCRKYLPK